MWTDEGWLYLAVIIDLYSRAVIGWSINSTMTRDLVCDTLKMALWRRGFPRDVICHSDRGSQYCLDDYQKLLGEHGYICSISRKGNDHSFSYVQEFSLADDIIKSILTRVPGKVRLSAVFSNLILYRMPLDILEVLPKQMTRLAD